MPDTTATQPFVVRRRGLGTTRTTLYLGTLVFALMVLLTLVCVVVALPFESLVEAVRQHAPHIPVTDRGRVAD